MNVLETSGLGKRYRSTWALRECNLAVPAGRIVALVGPNGAGKTTLLHCAVGLIPPTTGSITVLDGFAAGSPGALESIAFVAQDAPLHQHLSVQAMLSVAAGLNTRFDEPEAIRRLTALGIPHDRKVARLSGGQQAQLALTLSVARSPSLLVLDEPLARLDPLARHDFMAHVMATVAEQEMSVLFSSHVVSELGRVADYLVVLASGRVQMAGDIDELLASHMLLSGPADDAERIARRFPVVQSVGAGRRVQMLVRVGRPSNQPGSTETLDAGWERDEVSLEELVLGYLRDPAASMLPGPMGQLPDDARELAR